jgi:hypothetical protein
MDEPESEALIDDEARPLQKQMMSTRPAQSEL